MFVNKKNVSKYLRRENLFLERDSTREDISKIIIKHCSAAYH